MTVKLCHECLAETHNLSVATSTDREVGTTLAATHRQCSKGILECLLESKELKDREVYRRMESQAALIRTNGTVELYAIAYVYMHFALVVCPRHTERNDTLGFYKALDELCFLKLWVLVVNVLNRDKDFANCLQVLCFARVLSLEVVHNFFNIHSKRFFSCFI